jgi:hypothetical protein
MEERSGAGITGRFNSTASRNKTTSRSATSRMKYPDSVLESPIIEDTIKAQGEAESLGASGDNSKGHVWALTVRPSTRGVVLLQNFTPTIMDIEPHEVQRSFARELLLVLNKEAGMNGGWVVGYSHPPTVGDALHVNGDNVWGRLFMLWLDQDGDPQFSVEADKPFHAVFEEGSMYYVGQCYKAYTEWSKLRGVNVLKDLGFTEANMVKAAQGQKAKVQLVH